MNPLSNTKQGIFMLIAFILVPLGTWSALGFPVDRIALGMLASNLIAGVLLWVKEQLGSSQ